MSCLCNNINEKKTLVYFASGPYKDVYESLTFDKIYLVDYCFIGKGNRINGNSNPNIQVSKSGKIICLGMDCLGAVKYLNRKSVKIDYFVSLNEGLFEGGGRYAINSDMFLGYVIPILNDTYIHIMNKKYYGSNFHVTMDLPFNMDEIHSGESDYLDPMMFTSDSFNKYNSRVYRMQKQIEYREFNFNPKIKTLIIWDSIWSHYNELDLLAVSITQQGQGYFFDRFKKVISSSDYSIQEIFNYCKTNKIIKLGLTPWARGNYNSFIELVKTNKNEYPKEIYLFHLNKNDFIRLKSDL